MALMMPNRQQQTHDTGRHSRTTHPNQYNNNGSNNNNYNNNYYNSNNNDIINNTDNNYNPNPNPNPNSSNNYPNPNNRLSRAHTAHLPARSHTNPNPNPRPDSQHNPNQYPAQGPVPTVARTIKAKDNDNVRVKDKETAKNKGMDNDNEKGKADGAKKSLRAPGKVAPSKTLPQARSGAPGPRQQPAQPTPAMAATTPATAAANDVKKQGHVNKVRQLQRRTAAECIQGLARGYLARGRVVVLKRQKLLELRQKSSQQAARPHSQGQAGSLYGSDSPDKGGNNNPNSSDNNNPNTNSPNNSSSSGVGGVGLTAQMLEDGRVLVDEAKRWMRAREQHEAQASIVERAKDDLRAKLAHELAAAREEAAWTRSVAADEVARQRAALEQEQAAHAARQQDLQLRLDAIEAEKREVEEGRRQAQLLLAGVYHPGVLVTVGPAWAAGPIEESASVDVFPDLVETNEEGRRQGVVVQGSEDRLTVSVRYPVGGDGSGEGSGEGGAADDEGETEVGVALSRLQIFIPPPVVIVLPPPPSDADIVRNVLDIAIALVAGESPPPPLSDVSPAPDTKPVSTASAPSSAMKSKKETPSRKLKGSAASSPASTPKVKRKKVAIAVDLEQEGMRPPGDDDEAVSVLDISGLQSHLSLPESEAADGALSTPTPTPTPTSTPVKTPQRIYTYRYACDAPATIGDRLEARQHVPRLGRLSKWYWCKVVFCRLNGTYDVIYEEDGSKEFGVKAEYMRVRVAPQAVEDPPLVLQRVVVSAPAQRPASAPARHSKPTGSDTGTATATGSIVTVREASPAKVRITNGGKRAADGGPAEAAERPTAAYLRRRSDLEMQQYVDAIAERVQAGRVADQARRKAAQRRGAGLIQRVFRGHRARRTHKGFVDQLARATHLRLREDALRRREETVWGRFEALLQSEEAAMQETEGSAQGLAQGSAQETRVPTRTAVAVLTPQEATTQSTVQLGAPLTAQVTAQVRVPAVLPLLDAAVPAPTQPTAAAASPPAQFVGPYLGLGLILDRDATFLAPPDSPLDRDDNDNDDLLFALSVSVADLPHG
jgi:hypothetical protein